MEASTLFDDRERFGDLYDRAPSLARPWWASSAGARQSLTLVRDAIDFERAQLVDEIHVRAIADLARAAAAARQQGRHSDARRHAHAGARLCQELAGLWSQPALLEPR